MKKVLPLLMLAGTALSGCAIVPAEPVAVYASPPPPPMVVVRPYARYGYGYYGGGPRWRHWR